MAEEKSKKARKLFALNTCNLRKIDIKQKKKYRIGKINSRRKCENIFKTCERMSSLIFSVSSKIAIIYKYICLVIIMNDRHRPRKKKLQKCVKKLRKLYYYLLIF